MSELHPKPWEPEEAIGSLWHRLVGDRKSNTDLHPEKVTLESMRQRMGIVLRGLGGHPGTGFAAVQDTAAKHRRRFLQKIGHSGETVSQSLWDGETLSVPAVIGWSGSASANETAYLWLAGWAALYTAPDVDDDPLRFDLKCLRGVWLCTHAIQAAAPGLWRLGNSLDAGALANRSTASLSLAEAEVESLVRRLLGDDCKVNEEWWGFVTGAEGDLRPLSAPHGYCSYTPVAHWPQWRPHGKAEVAPRHDTVSSGTARKQDEGRRKQARRRESDQAKRRDPLILHRFETIKTWAEMFNLGRKVEDDDPETAQKAADDQTELGLADTDAKPATRISFDLDLSPQDVDRTRLATGTLYDEWDWKSASYVEDHVRVLASNGQELPRDTHGEMTPAQLRVVARVRRQFAALIPRNALQSGEEAGSELDLDATLRMAADERAGVQGEARIFKALRPVARDLAILTLTDVSRSTEGIAEERRIIDIAKETLLAMVHGLSATGDAHAISTFSSVRRDRVFYERIKIFAEPLGASVINRILALRPGHYTRLGGAIRQATADLRNQPALRRLLLIVTDGKPNDIDHYEGRYGIEDTRRAVLEARMAGLAVFAITIDRRAESYVPYIFGRNGFHIVGHPARLTEALPGIYRHLVG